MNACNLDIIQREIHDLSARLRVLQNNFVLPEQENKDNYILSTDGENPVWVDPNSFLQLDTVPTNGSQKPITSDAVYDLKQLLATHPTYVAPTGQLTSSQSTSGLEIGQTVSIPLTVGFTQNDAGIRTSNIILKDGVQISTSATFTDTIVITTTPKVYTAVVGYAQGAIKNNNFGEADASGRIGAGTINTNALSFSGFYKIFFGPVGSNPATSADVRGLSSQLENNTTFILNTGTTQLKFAVWVKSTHSLSAVTDLDAVGADLLSSYTLVNSSFSVNDAGGNPVVGKLYVMTQSVPYSQNHRHQITII